MPRDGLALQQGDGVRDLGGCSRDRGSRREVQVCFPLGRGISPQRSRRTRRRHRREGLDSALVHAVYSVYTEMTDTTANTCETERPDLSPSRRWLRVVIPGGAGHLGRIVAGHLHAKGNAVTVLSRSGAVAPWQVVSWNGTDPDDWARELEDADVVINVAGRSVNCRYNAKNRREILESRIRTTELLGEAITKLHRPPRLWVNASTATIYRHSLDREMDEANGKLGGQEPDVPDSWRFSIEVATSWERTLFAANAPHTRKIALRSAMVMSAEPGGTFDILLRLVRFGLGGACGSGKQFVSWIHESDFVRALDYLAAHEEIEGPVNVASPNPLRNEDFMRLLRKAWGSKVGLPASKWMLEAGAFFLRTETELILKSRRVVPGLLLASGFEFQFPEWRGASEDLVQRWRGQK